MAYEPACYMVFSEANGGCFFSHWSDVPVEGALARFVPKKEVPRNKFTHNGGRLELCRGVGGPNGKKFYEGWCSFLKMAHGAAGSFTFLANVAVILDMKRLAKDNNENLPPF